MQQWVMSDRNTNERDGVSGATFNAERLLSINTMMMMSGRTSR